jgi:hypothetical protein
MSLIRALCGAGQGLALNFVLRWIDAGGGAAALGVLVALAFAVPALLLSVPALSWRSGLAWSAALGLVLFGLGTYHGWQVPKPFDSEFFLPIFSILQMMFYVTFISSCLLLAGARDRRFIAGYDTYFDVA